MTAAEQLAATLEASGFSADDLIRAAHLVNSSAAPPDQINQKLDALHVRLQTVETVADKAFSLAAALAPYASKIRHLFDVHFGGKLG
jgi:hypothetical protein